MPGGIDWSSKENQERLLAALVEAQVDKKLDYKRIALFFGKGATYNSIECRFRTVRKLGEALRLDFESRSPEEAAWPAARKRDGSQKKAEAGKGVLSGRITKASVKKEGGLKMEQENFFDTILKAEDE